MRREHTCTDSLEVEGFEPPISRSQTARLTKLDYTSIFGGCIFKSSPTEVRTHITKYTIITT